MSTGGSTVADSRRMLERVEAIARRLGCRKLTLEVLEGNAPAQAAYRSFGVAGSAPVSKPVPASVPATLLLANGAQRQRCSRLTQWENGDGGN